MVGHIIAWLVNQCIRCHGTLARSTHWPKGSAGWSHNCLLGESMHTVPRASGTGIASGTGGGRCTWSGTGIVSGTKVYLECHWWPTGSAGQHIIDQPADMLLGLPSPVPLQLHDLRRHLKTHTEKSQTADMLLGSPGQVPQPTFKSVGEPD